jgi:hypothetical protein
MSCKAPENVPLHAAVWFSRFKDMLAFYVASPDHDQLFCVSWDRLNASTLGSKMFGIFQTPAHYFHIVRNMPLGTVCGYEIIMEGTRCRLYLDVEWETEGEADPNAADIIQNICGAVTQQCKTRFRTIPLCSSCQTEQQDDKLSYNDLKLQKRQEATVWKHLELDFYISTCSRLKNSTTFKNSFHIVVRNVIFPNNHDGMMKDFAVQLNFPNSVDKAVYSRNRCIRTELSAKSGQTHCFKNIVTLPDEHSSQESSKLLLSSLITVFDTALPTICYKKAEETAALSTIAATSKRSADIIRTETECRKKARSSDCTQCNALPILGAYFRHIFYNDTETKITVREIRDTDLLPPTIRLVLERKVVTSDSIFFVYIEKPKWCISQLMNAVKHRHHSNNACAVAVFVDGRMDIYARCYGCESPAYAKLATFDEKTKLLPSLRTNDAFRRVIHSPYGIDCVKDSADRKRVAKLFEQTQGVIASKLGNEGSVRLFTSSLRYMWSKYVESAVRGWFFISEPCVSTTETVTAGESLSSYNETTTTSCSPISARHGEIGPR